MAHIYMIVVLGPLGLWQLRRQVEWFTNPEMVLGVASESPTLGVRGYTLTPPVIPQ